MSAADPIGVSRKPSRGLKEGPRVPAREQVSAIRCPASPQGRRTQAQQNTSSTAKKRCPPPRRVGIMPRAAQILDSFGLRHPGVRPPQRIWLPAGSNTFPKSPDSDQPPGAKLSAPRRGLNPEPDTVVCSAWSPKPQGVKFPRLCCTPELVPIRALGLLGPALTASEAHPA